MKDVVEINGALAGMSNALVIVHRYRSTHHVLTLLLKCASDTSRLFVSGCEHIEGRLVFQSPVRVAVLDDGRIEVRSEDASFRCVGATIDLAYGVGQGQMDHRGAARVVSLLLQKLTVLKEEQRVSMVTSACAELAAMIADLWTDHTDAFIDRVRLLAREVPECAEVVPAAEEIRIRVVE